MGIILSDSKTRRTPLLHWAAWAFYPNQCALKLYDSSESNSWDSGMIHRVCMWCTLLVSAGRDESRTAVWSQSIYPAQFIASVNIHRAISAHANMHCHVWDSGLWVFSHAFGLEHVADFSVLLILQQLQHKRTGQHLTLILQVFSPQHGAAARVQNLVLLSTETHRQYIYNNNNIMPQNNHWRVRPVSKYQPSTLFRQHSAMLSNFCIHLSTININ